LCEFEVTGVSDGVVSASRKLNDFFCEKFGFDNILYTKSRGDSIKIGVFPISDGERLSATSMFSAGNIRNLKEGISEISGNNVQVVGSRRITLDPMEELDSIVKLCFEVNELRDTCKELNSKIEFLEERVDQVETVVKWLVDGIHCFAPELYENMMKSVASLPFDNEISAGLEGSLISNGGRAVC
jgi:hypothetical protein